MEKVPRRLRSIEIMSRSRYCKTLPTTIRNEKMKQCVRYSSVNFEVSVATVFLFVVEKRAWRTSTKTARLHVGRNAENFRKLTWYVT